MVKIKHETYLLTSHSTDKETKRIRLNAYADVKKKAKIVIRRGKREANESFGVKINRLETKRRIHTCVKNSAGRILVSENERKDR